jgi:NAD(P)-dependent dehydrogenase (short-subunit alcohol dehydrogenase family)
MIINLSGKTAVITGGSSGIGLAAAISLGRCGAAVAICGTNRDKLDAALLVLKKENIRSCGNTCDVSDSVSIYAFADWVEKELGPIGIWVSNAGVYPQYTLLETPDDVWQRTLDVNLKSVFLGGKIACRNMRPHGGGVLINASSFAALMPSVGSGLYAATKAAVSSMTRTLAAELAPHGIRVCGYIPGIVDTGMTHFLIEAGEDSIKDSIALHRIGGCSELADVITFLASDYASYISGTLVEVSGGKFCVQNAGAAWKNS